MLEKEKYLSKVVDECAKRIAEEYVKAFCDGFTSGQVIDLSSAIPKHRSGISDCAWVDMQPKIPTLDVGDVVRDKATGNLGVVVERNTSGDNPARYAVNPLHKDMPLCYHAWFHDLDLEKAGVAYLTADIGGETQAFKSYF